MTGMSSRREIATATAVLALVAVSVVGVPAGAPAEAAWVDVDEATYVEQGRVFPDPQACLPDGPGVSPWRKGSLCAPGHLTWDAALTGLSFLAERFPRYLDLVNLREDAADWPQLEGLDLRSAGLVRSDFSRERFDLYAIHVTDAESPVPEAERAHFAMALAMHGDERSGVEGGLRAIEDLVTWAACEEDPQAAPACATDGPFPKPILEPSDSGPTAGEVLQNAVLVFVFANPDGWIRGDKTRGGTIYHRGNGHGVDLNRDWPVRGYVEPVHTPWSEPESIGFGRYLEALRDRTDSGRFAGVIDFHGAAWGRALSLTLLMVDRQDLTASRRMLDVAELGFADAEERLAWSAHVAPAGECPNRTPVGALPMCSDLWGTPWETLGYNVSGAMTTWAGSSLGLDATALVTEMSNFFVGGLAGNVTPEALQLQVDATKGLLYTELTALLGDPEPESAVFRPAGRIAYLDDPNRTSHPGLPEPQRPPLPTQEPVIILDAVPVDAVEFDVLGPPHGVSNGGMHVDIRYGNAHGTSWDQHDPVLQHCAEECVDVARYVRHSSQAQAGIRLDLNDPPPGRYRLEHRVPAGALIGAGDPWLGLTASYRITFTSDKAYAEPEQLAYDVSRLDFFADLNRHVDGHPLEPVPFDLIARAPGLLNRYDTLVIADRPWPVPTTDLTRASYAQNLRAWVQRGGTLVLTDGALALLPHLDLGVADDQVTRGFMSTGWMGFRDCEEGDCPTYDRHPLAAGVDRPGSAEAPPNMGPLFVNGREVYTGPPLGFSVSPDRFGNRVCDTDRCDAPIWVVDQGAWEAAGGTTAARSFVRTDTTPGPDGSAAPGVTGVSLGELPLGKGVVRIAGALLPEPTEAHRHPYGLSSYAVTPTGYQVFANLLRRP